MDRDSIIFLVVVLAYSMKLHLVAVALVVECYVSFVEWKNRVR